YFQTSDAIKPQMFTYSKFYYFPSLTLRITTHASITDFNDRPYLFTGNKKPHRSEACTTVPLFPHGKWLSAVLYIYGGWLLNFKW
ncbi:hypothetical protein Q4S20_15880, partial [Morganella morganii]